MSKGNDLQPAYTKALPNGWRWTRLGEMCLPSPGTRDPRRSPEATFKYVDISGVDNARKQIVEARMICGKDAPSRARQVIRSGDVIVATTRPNLNAVALVPTELDGEICSTGFCVLRPTEALSSEFLFAFTQSQGFVKALSELVKGALYPAVTDSQVRAQLIPLPPLSEQKRIALLLGRQMASVEQARVAAETQLDGCIKLVEALLRESLSSPSAKSFALKDCLTEVTKGIGSCWREYPLLGVSRAGLAPPKEAIGRSPERYKTVDRGTIFYNPMRILLGSIALVDDDDDPGIASPDYVVCRTVEGVLHHRWFYYWLRSSFGEAFIKTLARGAVRERLLFKRLAAAEIVLPPWEAQVKAAERMKDVMLLRRAVQEQIAAINLLPAPLLAKAFSGQLSQRPSFRTRKATTPTLTFNMRGVVSSYIVNRLHEQPSFGNIQHQKLLFLTEAHVGLDLGGVYYRDKWGPHEGLEFYRLNGRRRWAEKRDVFHLHKRRGLRGYTYTVGANIAEQVAMAEVTLGDRKPALDALLDLFAPMTTDQAEMYATLFAVWNDFLIADHIPIDAEIIQEFRENWHERKQKFMPDQLRDALTFMRANHLVPRGIGPATRIKN